MKTLFLYITLFVLNLNSYGQDSLMSYLEISAKNNPAVLQKYYEYQAALQKVPQVGSLPDPELSVGIFLSPMELLGGNQVADIRLMQMFPWFGVLKSGKDEMSLMANAKFESFRDAKLQTYFDVERTWYELFKLNQNIAISEKNLDILKSLERLSIAKFQASAKGGASSSSNSNVGISSTTTASGGMQSMGSSGAPAPTLSAPEKSMSSGGMGASSGGGGLIDVYRIQMEMGELQNSIDLLKNQYNSVLARFNSYLNRVATSPIIVPDSLSVVSLGVKLSNISDSIAANNPMLTMLNYEQQSLEARKKMVSRMGYPMIGLGVNYSLINKNPMSTSEMNGKDMIMPMVTVTIPIYRKKYRSMVKEADLMQTATQHGIKTTSNALQTDYFLAVQQYEDASRRITLYQHQAELANKSLQLIMANFSSSGADLSEVLRIRQQTLDYEFKAIEAIVDYNTAVAWLKRLGGIVN